MDEREPDSVHDLMAEVLGVDHLDEDDNFFTAGGTSMMSIVLIERLQEDLGVEVPLEAFYDDPTLAGLRRLVAR